MMFTMAVSASPYKDVADDASYAEAVTVLNALSLMIGDDEGNFNPDQTITRAEAATVVVRAKGLGDAAAGAVGATAFTDVPADHWASGFINIATQSGIVAGYGDGTFGPSDPVTYEQMVKLIVAALGYTPKAEVNGGYPTGYLVIASQKNITKGATGNAGDPAPRKTVARLAYNALDVNKMEQTVFVKGAEEFEEVDDTLLDDLGIDKYEGVITSTYATKSTVKSDDESITMRYYSFNGVKDDDTVTFDSYGKTNAADLLGYYVTAYAEDDDDTDDYTILAIAPKSGKNDVVEIDYSQVDAYEVNKDGKFKSIDYVINQTDKNAITLDIVGDALLFYNGKVDATRAQRFITTAVDEEVANPGRIKFVSNGVNGDDYNYIFVTAYTKDYLVDEVNAARKTVYDKDGNKVDFDKDDVIYTIYKDGEIASFDDIEEGDVITLAESYDKDLVTIYVSSNSVTGTVTEATSDADTYYRIDGSLYRKASEGPSVKVGDEGTFYLNVDNRIVSKDAKTGTSAGFYAYVINAAIDDSLNGNKIEIKYLTEDGKWNTDYLATNITLYVGDYDGRIDKVAEEGIEGFIDVDGGDVEVTQQLVKFSKNSSGDINRVYLAASKDDDNFSLDKSGELTYKASNKKLGNNVFVEDDTIVISVPEAGKETTDEDDYTISTVKSIFSDDKEYVVNVYDMDDDYPAIIVVYGAETIIDPTTRLFVLTSVAKGRNENDVEVAKFYGYQEGESVSAEASEDGIDYYDINGKKMVDEDGKPISVTLKAGDVIIFGLDGTKAIDKIQVLFQASKAKTTDALYENEDDLDDDDLVENFYGVAVKKASGGKLTVDLKDTEMEDDNILTLKGNYNVYEVNVRNNNTTPVVSLSDYASIDVARSVDKGDSIDKVFVREYDGDVVDVVVYTYTADKDYSYTGIE